MELNEDLIVIEPKEAKEKLNSLVELIRKEKNWEVKRSLLTLLSIYLFQTYPIEDHPGCSVTEDEWEEIKDFCDYELERTSDDYLEESVEIHDELNPKIWTKEREVIPEVRAKILQIVEKFKALLALDNVDLKVEDIYLLGSNANFNYNEDSDLDIHIIADESFDCSNEHLKIIYDAYKSLFNTKYDITIKGINAEIYVENKDKLSNVSSGVYSFNKGWIKDPKEYEIPEFDQIAVDKGVQKWEDEYYAIMQDPSVKQIDKYIDDIYKLRVESIQEKGEFGEGNLIFKEIRRLGYLNDLKNKKIELTSKELSLEDLQEELHILEGQDKLRFHYRGPVRHFNTLVSDDWEDWTEAVSEKQALNNLTIKAKRYFGYSVDSKFSLNPDYLELSPKNLEPEEKGIEGKNVKCPKCGGHLNDVGECPICDLGDHSALDEHKSLNEGVSGDNPYLKTGIKLWLENPKAEGLVVSFNYVPFDREAGRSTGYRSKEIEVNKLYNNRDELDDIVNEIETKYPPKDYSLDISALHNKELLKQYKVYNEVIKELNNIEDNKKEEPVKVEEPKNARLNRARANNTKIIKAFKEVGLQTNDLTQKAINKNGKEYTKASDKLNKLRKTLFGESIEEYKNELGYDSFNRWDDGKIELIFNDLGKAERAYDTLKALDNCEVRFRSGHHPYETRILYWKKYK